MALGSRIMKKYSVKKWIALWLALMLAASTSVAAWAEEVDNFVVEVEASYAEEVVTELDENAIEGIGEEESQASGGEGSQAVEGEGVGQSAEEAPAEVPPAEEASAEGATVEQASAEDAGEGEAQQPEPSEASEEPAPVRLSHSSLKLGLKEKRKLTLTGDVSPKSVGAVFTTSDRKIVAVDKSTGVVTPKKKGTATITMKTADGETSTCKITVLKAPSRIKLSEKSLELGVGEERTLKTTISSGSASHITFSSNNKKVVKVDDAGHIVALKKGSAKITAKTFNGKRAVCKITVRKAPTSAAFGKDSVSLWKGDSYAPVLKLSKNSAGGYRLESDDESVVTVSGTNLKAVGIGTANIIATTYNGLTDFMSVEVNRRPVYRALLIGECTFPDTTFKDLPAKKDVSLMKSMLKSTQGPTKSKWSITTKTNRTTAQIRQDIQAAYAGAQEGDVSLFYISTHGDEEESFSGSNSEYAGYLVTYPDESFDNWYDQKVLTLPTLASWLKQVPGQVIVIIDSCGSGAAIYGATSNASGSSSAAATFSPGAFDGAVVNAFQSEDKGVVVPSMDEGAFVLKNKFYVLTSAGYQEACWTNNGKYSYFTKWLTEGIGTKGRMPADTNKNKQTTLKELYKYIKKRSEKEKITDKKGTKYQQHVQVYPAGSGFELFYRK